MVLLRRLVGDVLRRHRLRQARTLREVSAAAQVSLGYLSEVERGRKEASSELLAAICSALDVSLADVLREVSDDLAALERPVLAPLGFRPAPTAKVSAGARTGAVAGLPPLRATRPGQTRPMPERPVTAPPAVTRPGAPVAQLSARTVVAA
jgi:transcriptional regulator with XRE-family HTH domain